MTKPLLCYFGELVYIQIHIQTHHPAKKHKRHFIDDLIPYMNAACRSYSGLPLTMTFLCKSTLGLQRSLAVSYCSTK